MGVSQNYVVATYPRLIKSRPPDEVNFRLGYSLAVRFERGNESWARMHRIPAGGGAVHVMLWLMAYLIVL